MESDIEESFPSPDDYRKEDLKKATKILLKSGLSAIIITLIIYYLPI